MDLPSSAGTLDLRDIPITVVGAGAIGGTVGALLHQAGYDVTLVDADPEHLRAIEERGLRLTGVRGDLVFHPRAVHVDELEAPLEVVLLCVKAHFTERVVALLEPLLAPDGFVVSLQNGLNEVVIAERVGESRTLGAFVHFGADLIEPGLIRLGYDHPIYVGELDGRITPRVEAVRAALAHAMPAEATPNVWGFLWGKLVFGATAFTISCVDAPVAEVLDHPAGLALCRDASAEAFLVAQSEVSHVEPIGDFDPEAFAPGPGMESRAEAHLRDLAEAWRHSLKQHMGIWRDLSVKRRQTEVDVLLAPVVTYGRRLGIQTPATAALVEMVREIEQGRRGMGWDNLEELRRRAGLPVAEMAPSPGP